MIRPRWTDVLYAKVESPRTDTPFMSSAELWRSARAFALSTPVFAAVLLIVGWLSERLRPAGAGAYLFLALLIVVSLITAGCLVGAIWLALIATFRRASYDPRVAIEAFRKRLEEIDAEEQRAYAEWVSRKAREKGERKDLN